MKRIFLFTLLLCAFTVALFAQKKEYFKEKKHELRLSYGSVNDSEYYDRFRYPNGYYGNYYSNPFTASTNTYLGATKTTGVIGGSYLYNMSNLRFSFGGTLSYSGYSTDLKDRITDRKTGSIKGHNIALTPTVRYAWISKENFRLYSGIGWSFYMDITRYNLDNNNLDSPSKTESTFSNKLMVTPIGFSYGKDIFVFGEANIGGRVGNFVGGVGYRF